MISKTKILTLLLAFICTFSYAQKRRSSMTGRKFSSRNSRSHYKPTNYINNIKGTVFLGLSKYDGELSSRLQKMNRSRLAFGLGAEYRYDERFSFRGDLTYIRLKGTDQGTKNVTRNLSFKTDIYELNVYGVYDIFKYQKIHRKRQKFAPYLVLGFGVFGFTPKAELNGKTYKLRKFQTEGKKYSPISLSAQLGGGIRMKVTPHINVSAEMIYRQTFTDYLDDVSTTYPENLSELSPLTQQLSLRDPRTVKQVEGLKRGSKKFYDTYMVVGFRVDYTLMVSHQRNNLKKNSARLRMHKGLKKKR